MGLRLQEIAGPMLDDMMTALAAMRIGQTVKQEASGGMMGGMPPMAGMPPEMGMGGMPPEMAMAGMPPGGAAFSPEEQALQDLIAQQAMGGGGGAPPPGMEMAGLPPDMGPLPAMPGSPYA